MEERFLAYKVCVTKATINMKEMLLGMFVDFAQCEFIFVSHELQVIEGGGVNGVRPENGGGVDGAIYHEVP